MLMTEMCMITNPLFAPALQTMPHVKCALFTDYASREMCLPDIGLVHGRMIVTAWDFGLDDVEDAAVKLVMEGVQVNVWGVYR